jgi:hypothetical protein
MSISTDGRVSQWMIRKGFESTGIDKFIYFKILIIMSCQ